MKNKIKQLFCKHEWTEEEIIDCHMNNGGMVKEYITKKQCKKCGKVKTRTFW